MGTTKANYEVMAKALIERLMAKGFKPLGKGSTRVAFVRKNLIIKIPKGIQYFTDTFSEAYVSENSKKGIFTWIYDEIERHIKIAKTRLIYIDNIPIIVMEKVIPVSREETESARFEKAEWLTHMVNSGDGYQVGRDRKGEVKAFDFGHLYVKFRGPVQEKAAKAQIAYGEEGYSIDYRYFNDLGFKDSYGTNHEGFIEDQMHLLKFV